MPAAIRGHRIYLEEPSLQSHAASVLLRKRLYFSQLQCYHSERSKFLDSFKFLQCQYCGENLHRDPPQQLKKRKATIEHIVPINKNCDPLDTSNWAVCCTHCNAVRDTFTKIPKENFTQAFGDYLKKNKRVGEASIEFQQHVYQKLLN